MLIYKGGKGLIPKGHANVRLNSKPVRLVSFAKVQNASLKSLKIGQMSNSIRFMRLYSTGNTNVNTEAVAQVAESVSAAASNVPKDISVGFIEELIPITWWSLPAHTWLLGLDELGIPIWTSILVGTLCLRVLSLPLTVQQLRNASILNIIAARARRYKMKEKQATKISMPITLIRFMCNRLTFV